MTKSSASSMVASATASGMKITLTGTIDEFSDFDALTVPAAGTVEMDLAGVTRCNSMGVLRWARFLKTVPATVEVKLTRCSSIVVR